MAGLRTNALAALGAAVFEPFAVLLTGEHGVDPTRIAAYVVSSIGFLGAGVANIVLGTDAGLSSGKLRDVLPYALDALVNLGILPIRALHVVTAVAADACGLRGLKWLRTTASHSARDTVAEPVRASPGAPQKPHKSLLPEGSPREARRRNGTTWHKAARSL